MFSTQPEDVTDPRLGAYTAATVGTCLMGLIGIFIRHISMSAETIVLARFGLGFLLLACFLLYGGRFRRATFRFSIYSILSGVFMACSALFYVKAIKLTGLANAAILLYLGPLIAVVFAFAFLGERLSLASALQITLAFLGCVLILGMDVEYGGSTLQGNIFAVVSAFFYAFFIVTNRLIPGEVTPVSRAFYQLLVGATVVAPFALITPQHAAGLHSEIGWIVALGFLQGFLSSTLMIFSIEYLKAYQYGTISYLEPVVASLAGVTVYNETISFPQALGGIIILASGIAQVLLPVKQNVEPRGS